MLNKQQWLAKHASSTKFQSLTAAEKERRYEQYRASGPNPKFAVKSVGLGSAGKQLSKLRSVSKRSASVVAALQQAMGGAHTAQGHDYLTARFNPFCPRLRTVGYPDPTPGGSLKVRGFLDVTVVTNAAGVGFIACSSDAGANYQNPSVYYTSNAAAWTGTAPATFVPSGAPGTTSVGLPVPLGNGDDTFNGIFYRKLGYGIRIRSETMLLAKAGIATFIDFPGTQGLLGNGLTDNDYRSLYPNWVTSTVLDEGRSPWMSTIWSPKNPTEAMLTFMPSASVSVHNWDSANAVKGPLGAMANPIQSRFDQGILINGAPNATFQAQVVGFYEYMGNQRNNLMVSMQTPSYSDPVVAAAVAKSIAAAPANVMPRNTEGAVTLSGIFQSVASAGSKAISAYQQLQSYLPANTGGNLSQVTQISDISNEGSLGGFIEDAGQAMPYISEIEEAAPLLLTL